MPIQSPAYRQHLRNRQNAIDSEKLQELQKLKLFNERTFYRAFTIDMLEAKKEIVIYCPYVTKFRSEFFRRTFETLKKRNIAVFIFTRPIEEVDYLMRNEVKCALKDYEELGACIFYLSGLIHEKTAIIDREILWEGSLNILSQRTSKEMMRRTVDEDSAKQVMTYLGLNKKLAEGYKLQYERLYRSLVEHSKFNFKEKIRTFLTGFLMPMIAWWLFLGLRVMIFLLKGFKLLMSLIKMII